MRWPFGPPHLTLKPSKKKKTKKTKEIKMKKNEKKENKGKKPKKHKNAKKRAFQLSVIFFFFWWVSKISLFWQLGQKSAHPKNTIKIGVSATHFVENSSESRNGHFWTKKTQIQKFQLSFFLPFSSLTTTKNTKVSRNPYFYSVLANLKKRIFKI